MDSISALESMKLKDRKQFLDIFVAEVAFAFYRKQILESTQQEIEYELTKEVIKQNREIEKIESHLITRQFMPSIMPATKEPEIFVEETSETSSANPITQKTAEQVGEEEPRILPINSKIDPLLLQNIKLIECINGNVRIKKNGEFESTNIILNESEIQYVIKKFSELTKIPISDNILRATINKFAITALISDKIGSRFIIQKIS